MHDDVRLGLYPPASHAVHEDAADRLLYLPAAQAVQPDVDVVSALYAPTPQAVHAVDDVARVE